MPDLPGVPGSGGEFNYDAERERLLNVNGIAMINNVCPIRENAERESLFQNDNEKQVYREFIQKMVERYDGDSDLGCNISNGIDCYFSGDQQYPDQRLVGILQKNPSKYWQVCNQVTDTCIGTNCLDNDLYAAKYAEVMEMTYDSIKEVCSDCKVIIAGDSRKEEYPPVFKKLKGKYIDVIDFHRFGKVGIYDPQADFDYLKTSLVSSGFDISKLKFWITETGTYSGTPIDVFNGGHVLPFQTEKEHAQELFKIYVSAFGYGIEKVLWAWGIKEGFKYDGSIFDYTGFIYDGVNNLETDTFDRGLGVKKLAYYTFKLMTQKLNGIEKIETIKKTNGTYVYKLTKNNSWFYIAWSENNVDIILDGLNINSIKITQAVPKSEFGEEITDFNTAFDVETKQVVNKKSTITLRSTPIFAE